MQIIWDYNGNFCVSQKGFFTARFNCGLICSLIISVYFNMMSIYGLFVVETEFHIYIK